MLTDVNYIPFLQQLTFSLSFPLLSLLFPSDTEKQYAAMAWLGLEGEKCRTEDV